MVTMSDIRAEVRDLFRKDREHPFNPRPGLSIQIDMTHETLQELMTGRLDNLEIVGADPYQDYEDDRTIVYLYLARKGVE